MGAPQAGVEGRLAHAQEGGDVGVPVTFVEGLLGGDDHLVEKGPDLGPPGPPSSGVRVKSMAMAASLADSNDMDHPLLDEAVRSATAFIDSLPDGPVGRPADVDALRAALGAPLTDEGDGNRAALQALVAGAEGGLVATAGPRYFGFVNGGSLPVGLAADWLVFWRGTRTPPCT